MKIISIAKKDEKTVVVKFDNGEKLFLNYEIFLKNGLRKNIEISESRFSLLIRENQIFHIHQRAFRYLGRRLHSENELRIKLLQKKYDIELINIVLDELKEKKYLNDYEFASLFADENIKNKLWGKMKLNAELAKRGVDRNIVSQILAEKYPEGNELDKAFILAEKKYNSISSREKDVIKLNEKLIRFLISKGYDFETSREAARHFIRDDDD